MRRRVPLALRPCSVGSLVMGRIWIAMGMGWGVNRGGGDVRVMLVENAKNGIWPVEPIHAIRSEAIFGIWCIREDSQMPMHTVPCIARSALHRLGGVMASLVLTLTAGCTTIHITSLNGAPPRVERSLGLVAIRIPDNADDAVVIATRGFGAVRTPTGFTFGFWKEKTAVFGDPSTCRTVIWVEDRRTLDVIRQTLSDAGQSLSSLCIIDGDTK